MIGNGITLPEIPAIAGEVAAASDRDRPPDLGGVWTVYLLIEERIGDPWCRHPPFPAGSAAAALEDRLRREAGGAEADGHW